MPGGGGAPHGGIQGHVGLRVSEIEVSVTAGWRRERSVRSVRRDGDEREQGRQQDVADDDEGEHEHGVLREGACWSARRGSSRLLAGPG